MSHILLIEPSFITAYSYRLELEGRGHSVDHAVNAQEGIYCADAHCPDVVILEIKLAPNNGIEFLNEFRSYTEWQDVPVVITSMIHPGSLGNHMALRALGVADYLYKPRLRLNQLSAAISSL